MLLFFFNVEEGLCVLNIHYFYENKSSQIKHRINSTEPENQEAS